MVYAEPDRPSTRHRILDAGLDLIAETGLGALTHRAVEQRAGVSHGSTTYYFKTREAMVEALLDHLVAAEQSSLEGLPGWVPSGTRAEREAAIDRAVAAACEVYFGRHRDALARHELFLHAARRPELQPAMRRWREMFVDGLATSLAVEGAPHPQEAAHLVLAGMDGLMLFEQSVPDAAMRRWFPTMVRALLEAGLTLDDKKGPPQA